MISYGKMLLWENISAGRYYKLSCSLPSSSAIMDRCCSECAGALLAQIKFSLCTNAHTQNMSVKLGLAQGCNSKPHQTCCQGKESSDRTLQLPALTLSFKSICSSDFLLHIILSGVQQNISFIYCPSTYTLEAQFSSFYLGILFTEDFLFKK